MNEIEFLSWSGADNPDNPWWQGAHHVRFTVFVDEQHVPAHLEVDAADFRVETIHTLILVDDRPIATARLVQDLGDEETSTVAYHIGRVAVLEPYRGLGFGRQIMEACIEHAKSVSAGQNIQSKVLLDSQLQAMGFYESLGFIPTETPRFIDAGIWHQEMELTL